MATTIRIGDILFDEESGDVSRVGDESTTLIGRLPPQPAELLKLFVAHHPDMTSHQVIQETLWPGSPGAFEKNMHFCVRKIRAMLDDPASESRYVETIPRRGYRIAEGLEVERSPLAATSRQTQTEHSKQENPAAQTPDPCLNHVHIKRHRRLATIAIVACLLGACVWLGVSLLLRNETPIRVAVMTFEPTASLPPAKNDLAELLLERLTKHQEPQFHVIGPTTTVEFAGKPDALASLIEAHSIDYVINGRFLDRENNQLLAEVIRASDAVHVWVAQIEWRTDQRDAAKTIADGFLKVALGGRVSLRDDPNVSKANIAFGLLKDDRRTRIRTLH